MDSAKYPKSDPLALLLNEIEILLAQARLMELYLKQAEAAADDEMARLQERYEKELAEVRGALATKEESSLRQQDEQKRLEELDAQVAILEQQLADERRAVESREAELRRALSDTDYLRDRIGQLEAAREQAQTAVGEAVSARQELESDLDAVRSQLADQQKSYRERQLVAQQIQTGLQDQIAQLHARLVAQDEHSAATLRTAAEESSALRREINALQIALQEAQERAARETGLNRQQLSAELEALRLALDTSEDAARENRAAKEELEKKLQNDTSALRNELEQRQLSLNARAEELSSAHARVAALEQELAGVGDANHSVRSRVEELDVLRRASESKIAELENELAIKNRDLSDRQEREAELTKAQAEADALREKVAALEAAASDAETRAREIAEAARRDLENEITGLRATLARDEFAAARREQELRSALDQLNGAFQERSDELDRQHQLTEQTSRDLEVLRGDFAALEEQKAQSERARSKYEQNWQQASQACRELETRLHEKAAESTARLADLQQQSDVSRRQQAASFQALELELKNELARLREQVQSHQEANTLANREVDKLRAAAAAFEARHAQVEQSRREIEDNRNQTALLCQELEGRLQSQQEELRAAHVSATEQREQFEAKTSELAAQLAEKRLMAESRGVELGRLKSELEQLAQREAADNEIKAAYARDVEAARAAHHDDLARLQGEFQAVRQKLENELTEARQIIGSLNERNAELDQSHRAMEEQLRNREHELTAEIETWRARFDLVEVLRQNEQTAKEEVDQGRQTLETELSALRHELEQKAWASAQQQAALENLALAHKNQLQKLEAKIDEQQRGIEERQLKLQDTQSRAQTLEQRIESLQFECEKNQRTAQDRAQKLTEEYAVKIDDVNNRLAQSTAELQERDTARSALEQSLRHEVDRLIREAEEKNRILQDRNDELVRVKAELDDVTERIQHIESSESQAQIAFTGETERMRSEFQAQLALLQAELSQKEWALEEQRAAGGGVNQTHAQQIEALHQRYRRELDTLREELAQTKSRMDDNSDRFVLGEDRLTEKQQERLKNYREAMAPIINGDPAFPASDNRRWQSRFNLKRRWR